MKRFGILLFLSLALLSWGSQAFAQKLYLMCGGDVAHEKFGLAAQEGILHITSFFADNIPSEHLVFYNASDEWSGKDLWDSDLKEKDILDAIASCPAQEDDVLIVFWIGRGSFEKNDDFTLYLSGDDVKISRKRIVLALKQKGIRLTGLITDSGKVFRKAAFQAEKRGAANKDKMTTLMCGLFAESRGLIDINSCDKKQSPLIVSKFGTAFIESLNEIFEYYDYKKICWSDLVDLVNENLQSTFRGHRQQVHIWSLPEDLINNDEGIGAPEEELSDAERESRLRKMESTWDQYSKDYAQSIDQWNAEPYPTNYDPTATSLGEWSFPVYRPETGDLLIAINGQRIANFEQFYQAIQDSPEQIYLIFYDYRHGGIYELRTFLPPATGQNLRLGLMVVGDYYYGGVRVNGVAPGSPASHCQYIRGEWGLKHLRNGKVPFTY